VAARAVPGLLSGSALDPTAYEANFARRLSRIDWQSAPNRAVLSRPWTFTASRDPTPPAPSPLRGFGGDGAFAVATERRIP